MQTSRIASCIMNASAWGSGANTLALRTAVLRLRDLSVFLVARGLAPDACAASERIPGEALPVFGAWLRRHRGIHESSIRSYVREICALLPDLGGDPGRYHAALIRDALLRRFQQVSRAHAARAAISMRMYLRFLASSGACPPELAGAVPTAPGWRLATLPRYMPAADVERLIASCDTTTCAGLRDRAILLLLARLALRAGDVTGIKLDDIDWANARLRVCGKSKRSVGLPLPQDAGDAVLAYIEHARPRGDEAKLFLRVNAPHRPLANSRMISGIVSRALERAGIDNARPASPAAPTPCVILIVAGVAS